MANTISMGTQAGSSGGWELAGAVSLSSSQTNLLNGVDITPYKQIEILGSNISTNTTNQIQFNFYSSFNGGIIALAQLLDSTSSWGLFSTDNYNTLYFASSFSYLCTFKIMLYNSALFNRYYYPFEVFCGGSQSSEANSCIASWFFNSAITGNTTFFEAIDNIFINGISNTSTAYVYGLR